MGDLIERLREGDCQLPVLLLRAIVLCAPCSPLRRVGREIQGAGGKVPSSASRVCRSNWCWLIDSKCYLPAPGEKGLARPGTFGWPRAAWTCGWPKDGSASGLWRHLRPTQLTFQTITAY